MGMPPQPFLYQSMEAACDSRFPPTTFDPKAVTRASWTAQPPKPHHEGPLVSFSRRPQRQAGPGSIYPLMGTGSKQWIRAMRWVQLALRTIELPCALGVLAMAILLTNMTTLTGLIMRITPGVIAVHSIYAIYHLSRPAASRAPGSSAVYQICAAGFDLAALSLYAYGIVSTRSEGPRWGIRLQNPAGLRTVLAAAQWTLVGAAALHLVSLAISLWLGWMFRRIALMPPDMNPLEDHLTSRRVYKKLKDSTSTIDTDEFSRSERSSTHYTGSLVSHAASSSSIPRAPPGYKQSYRPERQLVPQMDHSSQVAGVYFPDGVFDAWNNAEGRRRQTGTAADSWLDPSVRDTQTYRPEEADIASETRSSGRLPKSYQALSQKYDGYDSSDSEPEQGYRRRDLTAHKSANRRPRGTGTPTSDELDTPASASGPDRHGGFVPMPPQRLRSSSIGLDSEFSAVPYGVGPEPVVIGTARQVSSGNDFVDIMNSASARDRRPIGK